MNVKVQRREREGERERQWQRARIRDIERKDYAYATLTPKQTINSCAMLCSVEHGTKNRSMRATEAVNQSAIRDLSSNKQTMKQTNKQKKRRRRRRRQRRRQSQDRQRANNWADLEEVFAAVWGYAITSRHCLPVPAILLCSDDAPMLSQATNELNSIIRPSKLMAASAEPGLSLGWRKLVSWETGKQGNNKRRPRNIIVHCCYFSSCCCCGQ